MRRNLGKVALVASILLLVVTFVLTLFPKRNQFDDIVVEYQGNNFEFRIPTSKEPFYDKGEGKFWKVVNDNEEVLFEVSENADRGDTYLGIQKGRVLKPGINQLTIERSNPSDNSHERISVQVDSSDDSITDITFKKIEE